MWTLYVYKYINPIIEISIIILNNLASIKFSLYFFDFLYIQLIVQT